MAHTVADEYRRYEDFMLADLKRLQCTPASQVFIQNPDRQWVYRHALQMPIAQPFYAHHYDPIFHRYWRQTSTPKVSGVASRTDAARKSLLLQHYENDIVY